MKRFFCAFMFDDKPLKNKRVSFLSNKYRKRLLFRFLSKKHQS
jgi:hypothetical protein